MKFFIGQIVFLCCVLSLSTSYANEVSSGSTKPKIEKSVQPRNGIQSTIALVNTERALLESEAAKDYAKESQIKLQPKLDEIHARRDQLKVKQNELDKNSLSLSKDELLRQTKDLEEQRNKLVHDFNLLRQEAEIQNQQQINLLSPHVEEAIKKVAEKGRYSLVLDRSAIRYNRDIIDITDRVIDEFNLIIKKEKQKQLAEQKDKQEDKKKGITEK